jgi:hypothetical protein
MEAMKRVLVVIALLAECLGALYAAFATWLLSDWFISDSLAFRLDSVGWFRIGGIRLLYALALASTVSLLVYLLNRHVLARLGPPPLFRRLHWYAGGLVAIAGLAGVTRFVVERPYM